MVGKPIAGCMDQQCLAARSLIAGLFCNILHFYARSHPLPISPPGATKPNARSPRAHVPEGIPSACTHFRRVCFAHVSAAKSTKGPHSDDSVPA